MKSPFLQIQHGSSFILPTINNVPTVSVSSVTPNVTKMPLPSVSSVTPNVTEMPLPSVSSVTPNVTEMPLPSALPVMSNPNIKVNDTTLFKLIPEATDIILNLSENVVSGNAGVQSIQKNIPTVEPPKSETDYGFMVKPEMRGEFDVLMQEMEADKQPLGWNDGLKDMKKIMIGLDKLCTEGNMTPEGYAELAKTIDPDLPGCYWTKAIKMYNEYGANAQPDKIIEAAGIYLRGVPTVNGGSNAFRTPEAAEHENPSFVSKIMDKFLQVWQKIKDGLNSDEIQDTNEAQTDYDFMIKPKLRGEFDALMQEMEADKQPLGWNDGLKDMKKIMIGLDKLCKEGNMTVEGYAELAETIDPDLPGCYWTRAIQMYNKFGVNAQPKKVIKAAEAYLSWVPSINGNSNTFRK